jgi:hypothetical protein
VWPFRRRARGRHALGAAVTAIPSLPAQVPPAPRPVVAARAPEPTPEAIPEPVAEPTVPRVELGFRDGSSAALAPWSEQAKALTDIASLLTQRDPADG